MNFATRRHLSTFSGSHKRWRHLKVTTPDTTPQPPADPASGDPASGGSGGHRSLWRRLADHYEGLGGGGKSTVLAAVITVFGTLLTAIVVPLVSGSGSGDQTRAENRPTFASSLNGTSASSPTGAALPPSGSVSVCGTSSKGVVLKLDGPPTSSAAHVTATVSCVL